MPLCFWRAFSSLADLPWVLLSTSLPMMDVAFPFITGVSFYTVSPGGSLTLKQQVQTGGYGIAGGFFGANRISVLDNASQQCVYASEALSGNIVGISINTLTVVGSTAGSPVDAGSSNGVGLAMNNKYLYASFTDSTRLAPFKCNQDAAYPSLTMSRFRDWRAASSMAWRSTATS